MMKPIQLLFAALVFSGLYGCTSGPNGSGAVIRDGAPRHPVDVSVIPRVNAEPVARTKAGNKSPYTVFGKTYELLPDSRGYRTEGIASWYGTKFHGRKTSNGEIFNMYGMTAAHKFLPIPTYAEVTNLENGKQVVVRINDRGPFHDDREIDLSWAAAEKLGFAGRGTARVRVVALDPDTGRQPRPDAVPSQQLPNQWRSAPNEAVPSSVRLPVNSYYQIASVSDRLKAGQLARDAQVLTKRPAVVEWNSALQNPAYKVLVGPVSDRREIPNLAAALHGAGVRGGFVVQLKNGWSIVSAEAF